MNRTLAYKLGAIALLIVLLLIPLLMIDGLIGDRQKYRDEVLQDIARSASYSQHLTGPLVVVPYPSTIRAWVAVDKTSQKRVLQEREQRGELYFLPDGFSLDGQMRTELRHRGIYQARLFHVDSKVGGSFQVPAGQLRHQQTTWSSYRFETPFLAVGISDIRGIENALRLKLKVGDELRDFQPGTQSQFLGNGVHAVLPFKASRRAPGAAPRLFLRPVAARQRAPGHHPGGPRQPGHPGGRLAAPELRRRVPAQRAGGQHPGLHRTLAHQLLRHQPGGTTACMHRAGPGRRGSGGRCGRSGYLPRQHRRVQPVR